MSVEAITWVLNEAPGVPPQLVSMLIGIANHAGPDGRNAYPAQSRLATYTRKAERTVRRDLAELEKLGLIRRGDQRVVEHLPRDRRPVVYDLVMTLRGTSQNGRTHRSPRTYTSGRPRPDVQDRGDAHDRPSTTERGDVQGRNGGTPTSAKPSLNQQNQNQSVARGRTREAHRWLKDRYGLTDNEAAAVMTEAQRRAAGPIDSPVPYLETMAGEGHLADIVTAVTIPSEPTPPQDWPPATQQMPYERTVAEALALARSGS